MCNHLVILFVHKLRMKSESTVCIGQTDLRDRLEDMRIEPDGAELSFQARLAAENGWSQPYAKKVDAEYRKFLFLAVTCDHPVTPSDEVDQVWHLHLLYSRSYWEDLCGRILGKPLHHGPTAGGAEEKNRYILQYEATLEAYRRVFEVEPPEDIWPKTEVRFSVKPLRIDASRFRPIAKGSLIISMFVMGFAWMANVIGSAGFASFALFAGAILCGLSLTASLSLERGNAKISGGADGGGCSGCGGCGGCG